MSWITTPATTVWPETTPSGVKVGSAQRVTEPEGVQNRRTGCGYDWSPADRTALLALADAVEHSTKPTDWSEPEE